jgi:multiple antibiotic resistance protein
MSFSLENEMSDFWLCFVPLFVAVDIVGNLPIFITLTSSLERKRRRIVTIESILTALAVSAAFLFVGKAIFAMLGIEIPDFMVAGGILLFLLSVNDLLHTHKEEEEEREISKDSVGPVPLGVPLIAGPAVLTTLLILAQQHGYTMPLAGLGATLGITFVVLWYSEHIMKLLGRTGSRILSKLANLLMAAIGVMFVRRGIEAIIKGLQ